jgi:formylglycine-generating enzyme required for sulfatase activity
MEANPSDFNGGSGKEAAADETQNQRPVEYVNWYHAIAFCNKMSIDAGKEPVYSVDGITDWAGLLYGSIPIASDTTWDAATMDMSKNGYRLPTEMEWMWAAMGATLGRANVTTKGWGKGYAGSAEGLTFYFYILNVTYVVSGQRNIDGYAWYDVNAGNKTHEVGKKTANELGLYDMSGNVYERCWDWYSSYPNGELTDYTGGDPGSPRVVRGGGWYNNAYECAVAYRYYGYPSDRIIGVGFRVSCP